MNTRHYQILQVHTYWSKENALLLLLCMSHSQCIVDFGCQYNVVFIIYDNIVVIRLSCDKYMLYTYFIDIAICSICVVIMTTLKYSWKDANINLGKHELWYVHLYGIISFELIIVATMTQLFLYFGSATLIGWYTTGSTSGAGTANLFEASVLIHGWIYLVLNVVFSGFLSLIFVPIPFDV